MERDCEHGSLARTCRECELLARIAELEALEAARALADLDAAYLRSAARRVVAEADRLEAKGSCVPPSLEARIEELRREDAGAQGRAWRPSLHTCPHRVENATAGQCERCHRAVIANGCGPGFVFASEIGDRTGWQVCSDGLARWFGTAR